MTVPATEQYRRVINDVATQLLAMLDQRVAIARELDDPLPHPLAGVAHLDAQCQD